MLYYTRQLIYESQATIEVSDEFSPFIKRTWNWSTIKYHKPENQ